MYRRYTRRRFNSRRRRPYAKRKVFGKRATRAIKAISQRPVETKWYIYDSDVLSDIPPVAWPNTPLAGFVVYRNIFDPVPRTNNVGSESRSEVIGQKFNCRGISVKGLVSWGAAGDVLGAAMRVRVSIIKTVSYFNVPNMAVLSSGSDFFEDDDPMAVTVKRFNMDRVKVLKSQTFTMTVDATNTMKEFKMYYKCRNTMTCYSDEGTVTSTTVGRLKTWNYYLVIETLANNGYAWNQPAETLYVSTKVYWKDP